MVHLKTKVKKCTSPPSTARPLLLRFMIIWMFRWIIWWTFDTWWVLLSFCVLKRGWLMEVGQCRFCTSVLGCYSCSGKKHKVSHWHDWSECVLTTQSPVLPSRDPTLPALRWIRHLPQKHHANRQSSCPKKEVFPDYVVGSRYCADILSMGEEMMHVGHVM